MSLGLIALWKGLPFAGKVIVGISAAYVAHKTYQYVSDQINEHLDEHHPEIEFRLSASVVGWGVKVVTATVKTALADDKDGEFARQLESATVHGIFQFLSHVIAEALPENWDRDDTAAQVEIIASGVYLAIEKS